MTLGTGDKKKVWALAVFGLLAAYMVYANLLSGPSAGTPPSSQPAPKAGGLPAIAVPESTPARQPAPLRAGTARGRSDEFHPVLRSKRLEERIDPAAVDPTLRLDLLSRVQSAGLVGGSRNLFQFSTPPPKEVAKLAGPEPVVKVGPVQPPPPPPPPPPAPPPAITIKFYGYSTAAVTGRKTAYFLDGEDILLGGEGDTLKRRYKVVRILPASVLIEDLDAKRQQSVPLTEEAQS
jgi:hypothetical protein